MSSSNTTCRSAKVVIIGGGIAGCMAAINAGTYMLDPVLLASPLPPGIAGNPHVVNFPGFPGGISGTDLVKTLRRQAKAAGAEIIEADASCVDLASRPFRIVYGDEDEELLAHTLIIASGRGARSMKVPFAVVDADGNVVPQREGLLHRKRRPVMPLAQHTDTAVDKSVVVVGGGDTAVTMALHLAKVAKAVRVVVRGSESKATINKLAEVSKTPNISVMFETQLESATGPDASTVAHVTLRHIGEENATVVPCDAVYLCLGSAPHTDMFDSALLQKDPEGYIVLTESGSQATSVHGVFVAGDVSTNPWKSSGPAVGAGAIAAMQAAAVLKADAKAAETDSAMSATPAEVY
eukprot:gnl/Ergobibamus_cyprinoides/2011.p1 GENE.gnl/Ergobibamus_cyprinoides/2011~~gnl/Ergobibamus_cyprinoides/2011.p1  ORF type:complete len:360 (+),score=103.83 gnl/Ergobibamus_cyprinoides/2011:29-1081(+)